MGIEVPQDRAGQNPDSVVVPRKEKSNLWSFGGDDVVDTPTETPPGFKIQRAIPENARYGQLLVCRACGAVVGPRSANINDHVAFHDTLEVLVDRSLRMRYTAENPRPLPPT